MTIDRQRVFELLEKVLDIEPAARPAAIDELCDGDEELRRRLETLLALETEADDYLEGSVIDVPAELEVGSRLGPYRIVELIGRGGMGAVYRATRELDFEKAVAIKIIRQGLPRSLVVRRFHIERQILARLEHPGIARLLDGGTTADGCPYLVMEHIDGVPILDYCRDHGFDLRRRLELFLQVLEAVAYAHRRLVVHRDLKPDNILITPDGTAKLLDFGIAKLLDPTEALSAELTLPAERPMTLLYASPEQVRRQSITTASDIYSLGVVLHHLLTGKSPYPLTHGSWSEMVRVVCERQPELPSSLLPAGTQRRGLVGDVDAILLQALRKEPHRRFASVERFADDIRHFFEHRPVRARRSTWLYRSSKLFRRRPAATGAVVLLVVFSLASTGLWRRAERQRVEAVRDQVRAERVAGLLSDVFRSADPDTARGAMLSAQSIVDQARARLSATTEDEPELEADMASTLARLYTDLGLHDHAAELLERCIELRRGLHPDGHPELDAAVHELAELRRLRPENRSSSSAHSTVVPD